MLRRYSNNNNVRIKYSSLSASIRSKASSSTTNHNNEQNQNISSFLQRLLETSRDFSLEYNNNSKTNNNNNNIFINNIFNEMIQNSNTIEDIFSHTEVRFHSVRVPVQREKAKLRAMKRKSQQHNKKKHLAQNSSTSNDKIKGNDGGYDIERQNRDDDDNDDRQDHQADDDVVQDPTTTVKSLTNDQSREATRKLRRLPFINQRDTKFPNSNNSNSQEQQHHQYKLPVKIICSAAKDMREDRFCVYLKTVTEKIRVRYGALQADNFAGFLCRFWLNSQKNAGLSFPSSETAYSPLLPTMLFFSAARDPALFKELVLRIDRERGRFGSQQNQNNNNSSSSSTASARNKNNNNNNRYGISSFTSSTMVGWVAAVSVTIETAIPVLRKNLLDLQKENAEHKNLEKDIIAEEAREKKNIDNNDDNNIVSIAAKKLQNLLVDERCFTVASPIDAIRAVLPVVLSVLLNPLADSPNSTSSTASFFQLRQNLPPISIVSFISGTKQSASTFELWNKFTKRFLLPLDNEVTSQHQQQNSKMNVAVKRKITHSFANSPIPPYFVSFVLQTCQQEADSLLSPTKASQITSIPFRVSPTTPAALMSSRNKFGALPLILNNNYSTNITATMDEIVSLAVGTFSRAMRDSVVVVVLTMNGRNPSQPQQQQQQQLRDKIPFILYSRLLRALASCGCASWVMETVVKDCLAVLHGHTSLNLCHVVANAMHHQKTREAMLLLCNTVQRGKICEDDFYSKWTGHAVSVTENKNINRLRHHHTFVLLPSCQQQQQQQTSSLALPVDTVNCSISNDMWNTLVDSCTLLVSSSSSSSSSSSKNDDNESPSSSLPPVLLRQLTFTRIRSSCLELVCDPSKIFDLLNILQQRKDDATENEDFENFFMMNNNKVDEDEGTNTSWCDPVVVLPKWFEALSSSSSNNSVFSELRLQSLSCLFAALADISEDVRNVFSSPRSSSSSSSSRLEIATAAARLVDYIVEKSLLEDTNNSNSSQISNDENNDERNSRKHGNFENFIPVYWETVCTIAVTTNDVHWLHDQYLFLMLMTPNNSKSGGGGSPVYGAKLLARHLTPSILKKTCHVLVQNFGTSKDIRFYRSEEGTTTSTSSTPSVSSRCVALNKLVQRICKYTGQYSLQLVASKNNNNERNENNHKSTATSSFIMLLIDSDPDVDFCLRPKQRVGNNASVDEYDDPSLATTTILQYYHQDRMKSKKSVLELNTSVANSSFGGSQFGLAVEAGRGLITHRNAVAACAIPTMSAIHPATTNALQVALQSAHSTAPFSVASDVVFAKKMSWRTSGIGRQSRNIFLVDHDEQQQQQQGRRELEHEEGINMEEDDGEEEMMMMMKGAKDCITDIIEGYAK